MCKNDFKFVSKSRQDSVGCRQQEVCGKEIRKFESSAFEYSPKRYCKIEIHTIFCKKEEEQSSLFQNRTNLSQELTYVDTCIVKEHKCILTDAERKPVDKVRNIVTSHVFGSGKSLTSVVWVNHAKNIASQSSFEKNIDISIVEIPPIRYISFSTDMAFISIIRVYENVFLLLYGLFQLLGLIRIELHRVGGLGTFPCTSIFYVKVDEKALKVLSIVSLSEALVGHASFIFLTLCQSSSMALCTASSSKQSIIDLQPRQGESLPP